MGMQREVYNQPGTDYREIQPTINEYQPQERGWLEDINRYFQGDFLTAPGQEVTRAATQAAAGMAGRAAPGLEQFYSQMVETGFAPQYQQQLRNIAELGEDRRRQILSDVLARGPGGTATTGAAMRGLRTSDLEERLAMGELALGAEQQAIANRLAGAQSLQGLPSIYTTPSSLEQAMLARRQGYDVARAGERGAYERQRLGMEYYQPQRIVTTPQVQTFESFMKPGVLKEYIEPLGNLVGTILQAALMMG